MDNDGDGSISPGSPDGIHTSIHALNLYLQLSVASPSTMAAVVEIHSLTSGFKIGLPQKAVLKLKLKMEVERRKATKWDPARVENVYGEDLRGSWLSQRSRSSLSSAKSSV